MPVQPIKSVKGDMNPNRTAKLNHLIVDSGAIIRGHGMSFSNLANQVCTVPEVLAEIRDSKSRDLLDTLPYTIAVRSPTDVAMREVADFARRTGDFAALSLTDLKLIALLYTVETEINGTANLRKAPEVSTIPAAHRIICNLSQFCLYLEESGPENEPQPCSSSCSCSCSCYCFYCTCFH